MTQELGAWLRAQRQARGWNASEMARQLRRAAKSNGDTLPGNQTLFTYLRRWEHGLVCPSERGEDHGFGMDALAHIDLAAAVLRAGQLDAAATALAPVLSLPQSKRINDLPQRLSRVRAELASPRYQGSPQARELDEGIEEFTRDTIVAGLHELPS